MRPLIGISCCIKPFGIFATPNHAASDSYVRVVSGPVGGTPVLLPAAGEEAAQDYLAHINGLILTGSRSNVWPGHYDGPPHAEGTPEDQERDATTLPLIRAAIATGIPLLAICRGMQELNVALGGSLDQRVQDLPGRMDHSTPSDQKIPLVRTGKAHLVRIDGAGALAATLTAASRGTAQLAVNWRRALSRKAGRQMAQSKRCAWKARAALPSACNGTPNMTGNETPIAAPFSKPLAAPPPPMPGRSLPRRRSDAANLKACGSPKDDFHCRSGQRC